MLGSRFRSEKIFTCQLRSYKEFASCWTSILQSVSTSRCQVDGMRFYHSGHGSELPLKAHGQIYFFHISIGQWDLNSGFKYIKLSYLITFVPTGSYIRTRQILHSRPGNPFHQDSTIFIDNKGNSAAGGKTQNRARLISDEDIMSLRSNAQLGFLNLYYLHSYNFLKNQHEIRKWRSWYTGIRNLDWLRGYIWTKA